LPLYAYRCTECSNRYEKIQSFSSEVDTVCPKCGGKVERPLTAPGLSFKGAGWYVNDYASKSSGSSSSDDVPTSEAAAASESKSESKSKSGDAKPAATESKSTTTESPAKPSSSTTSS
jgi:putative FmdB family regulatory protein